MDNSGTYGAPQQTVNPNEMVGTQLDALLAGNSPYIQQARAQGAAAAAGRGLLNSSMASGQSENAAIAAGEPIAAAQAQQYAQVAASNQQASTAILGAQIGADAQANAAQISADAQQTVARINSSTSLQESAQQFQEYGMGLGYQYAQLGQQGQQFNQQLQQNATQFTQQLNQNIGEFQSQQSFAQYQLGLTMQAQNQQNYATMFSNIMLNPNMTADERSAALNNAQSFFSQSSQYNASIPAFVPPWVGDPSYWSNEYTAP